MRTAVLLLAALPLSGCGRASPPALDPPLPEPATFAAWPSVTDKPVPVGPQQWTLCRAPSPEQAQAWEAEAKRHGPHAGCSVVVRVSPEAVAAFREDRPLPAGAVVVKEKHVDPSASGSLQGYAVMVKRAAGYDPENGDWEYGYVTLVPERTVSRGRLANCAGCHATARDRDYLFRSYPATSERGAGVVTPPPK